MTITRVIPTPRRDAPDGTEVYPTAPIATSGPSRHFVANADMPAPYAWAAISVDLSLMRSFTPLHDERGANILDH